MVIYGCYIYFLIIVKEKNSYLYVKNNILGIVFVKLNLVMIMSIFLLLVMFMLFYKYVIIYDM